MNKIAFLTLLLCLEIKTKDFKSKRITGGTIAATDQFPFFVQINITEPLYGKTRERTCGAALIQPQWILTASHCFDDLNSLRQLERKDLLVVYMSTNIRFDKRAPRNFIKKIHLHPDFYIKRNRDKNVLESRNDIALGQLKNPYNLDKSIQTVLIPQPIQNMAEWTKRCTSGTAVGVGITKPGLYFPQNVLFVKSQPKQLSELRVGSIQIRFRPNHVQLDTTFFTLAEWLGGHTLSGDSGGPFTCTYGNTTVIYGICSMGAHELKINHRLYSVGIFERVDKHLNFILSKVPKAQIYRERIKRHVL